MVSPEMKETERLHGKDQSAEQKPQMAERQVDQIGRLLMLPREVRARAMVICSDAIGLGLGQSFSPNVLAAASVYVTCREERSPVTLKDLAATGGSNPREVGRCYLKMLERMHISRPDLNGRSYVYHLSLKRAISQESLKLSQEIIKKAYSKGLGGRNPMTLAAASLYLACCSMGENVTQSEVAEAAGVGEESVRECCKELRALDNQPSQS